MVQTRLQKKLLRRGKKNKTSTTSAASNKNKSSHSASDDGNPDDDGGSPGKRRRSNRGSSSGLEALANRIVRGDRVVFLTGAGLSVASGVRPFRQDPGEQGGGGGGGGASRPAGAPAGLWNSVIWSTATRECFRKDPLRWYNKFFLPHFVGPGPLPRPNWGHRALDEIRDEFPNVCQVTQNIDGLQPPSPNLIEVHGRVGLYKCLNDEDDDSDWDESDLDEADDDDPNDNKGSTSSNNGPTSTSSSISSVHAAEEDKESDEPKKNRRRVRLGHRGKGQRYREHVGQCPYRYREALPSDLVEGPPHVRSRLAAARSHEDRLPNDAHHHHHGDLDVVPTCPGCGKTVMPLALLFDEGYHSHSFYQFEAVEAWIEAADVLVFCGTSFSVRVTSVALRHAQKTQLPVYNFNTVDLLSASKQLDVTNIVGDVEETLPRLIRACRERQRDVESDRADTGDGPKLTLAGNLLC